MTTNKPDPLLPGVADLLSAREAAEALGVSLQTIRGAIRRKELPAFVVGGRSPKAPGRGLGYRIRKTDLQAWFFGEASTR